MKIQNFKNSVVSVQWLAENSTAENIIIIEAMMKPVGGVKAQNSSAHIRGALAFDIDGHFSDPSSTLPHMMPSVDFLTDEFQKMGINNDSMIVAYDNVGIYSSPRVWWMFRALGHDQIAVLDGGLPAWIQAGYETTASLSENPNQRGNFASDPRPGLFVDSNFVSRALANPHFSVIDARSEGRFKGQEPEPRAGVRSGHSPNSQNIPFASVLENGMLLPEPKLKSIFEKYKDKKTIFQCGSGVTACVVALAAEQAGLKDLSVYDGSWAEWGKESSGLPVEKG